MTRAERAATEEVKQALRKLERAARRADRAAQLKKAKAASKLQGGTK